MGKPALTDQEIRQIIIRELPELMETDPEVEQLVLELIAKYCPDREQKQFRHL